MKRHSYPNWLLAGAGLLIPALASRVARRLAGHGFEAITHRPPPRNPAALGVSWKNALLWTAVSGALGGIVQMATRKGLTGRLPTEGAGGLRGLLRR